MFRLEIEAGAEEKLRKELTFGIVPAPRRMGPGRDSVFATHAILSNPHYPNLAAQMGMRWTRLWGGNISSATLWRSVEPDPGRFEWNDGEISLARGLGLNILGMLGGRIPLWIGQQPTEWTDEDLQAWGRYVFETVSHYHDDIGFWEVWNEPYWTFKSDGAAYVRVLKAAYEAAKEADPGATIVGTCGPPWSIGWYESVFAAGGLQYQDIVSAHLYPPGGGNAPLDYDETLGAFVASIRAAMRTHGEEKELWDTEAGMTPASPFNRLIRPHYFRNYGNPVPAQLMTEMTARLYVTHLAEGIKFFYYLLHGSFEYDSSLCENDGSPLPAAAAIAVAASVLDGAEFVKTIDIGPVRARAFTRGDEGIVTLWGVGLQGRRPDLPLALSPRTVRDVMGNPAPVARRDGSVVLPISPSPLYLSFETSDLGEALRVLEASPPPDLEKLVFQIGGVWEGPAGPAISVNVSNLEPEPVPFRIRLASLPDNWTVQPREHLGREGEYVVHGGRQLLFPVALADEGAARAGEVEAAIEVDGKESRVRGQVELPDVAPPRPAGPHQPPPELVHRGIEFVSGGPWTIKVNNGGLEELYFGPERLLSNFYFYTARQGLNSALLSFRDCKREVEALPDGARIRLSADHPPYGTCELSVEAKGSEVVLRWHLSHSAVEDAWGELGVYVPAHALAGGYPCDLAVTPNAGPPRPLALSAERHPMPPLVDFKALAFRTDRREWGMDMTGSSYRGSHQWYLQDFRENKGKRDHYRLVMSFSAAQDFEADVVMRVWVKEVEGGR